MDVRIGLRTTFGLSVIVLTTAFAHAGDKETPVSWKKTVIEGKFRSEGVAIADVNNDGKLDVLDRRLVVRGSFVDQARHPQARQLRRRAEAAIAIA